MAIGDIIRIINSLDFDLYGGALPKIIHIAGTVYAIAYQGYKNDGYLKTVTIQDNGTIGGVIESLEFDTANGAHPWIIHIAGTVYAIAYVGTGFNGTLKTLHIADDGDIGAIIQTFVYDSGASIIEPMIVHISGTTYAIAYGGPDSDGWLKTVTINDDGTIGGEIDFLEFDTSFGVYPHILHIAGTVYAIAYPKGIFGPGSLITLPIAADGSIGAIIKTFQFEDGTCEKSFLFHVSGNIYAIAYRGPGPGSLKTINIADDGTIGTIIDSFVFDTGYAKNCWVLPIGDNVFVIAYDGPAGDGWMKTVTINDDGTIEGIVSELEYDDASGQYQSMIHVSDDTYAIAYNGPGNDGWLKTVEITTPAAPRSVINKAYALSREEL